jgi:hypothetical protein
VVVAALFAPLSAILLALAFNGALDRTAAFFGAGTSLLIACLSGVAFTLRRPPRSSLDGHGWWPVWRIGLRNASDRPGRSILAIGVIASATFIVIAVDAFRREGPPATDRHSGVGGYPLLVDLLLPIANDPNTRDGRESLGLNSIDRLTIEPFRVLPGDDASCLNLYEPKNPRVLGVSRPFIESGRFAFQSSLATTDAERMNPWLLLNRDVDADIVPVIADANSMTYVLHKRLGDDVVITRGSRTVRLRLVAALADSIFQGELLMSDASFARLFPQQEGYRFLLIDAPEQRGSPNSIRWRTRICRPSRRLADWGSSSASSAWVPSFCETCSNDAASSRCLGRSAIAAATSSRSSWPRTCCCSRGDWRWAACARSLPSRPPCRSAAAGCRRPGVEVRCWLPCSLRGWYLRSSRRERHCVRPCSARCVLNDSDFRSALTVPVDF